MIDATNSTKSTKEKMLNEQHDDIIQINPTSPDFRTELADKIAELAPESVADGKIDLEKLKELLAEDVDNSTERFGLFWPGKRQAIRMAQTPTTATLKPDKEKSKNWDTTQNVFIEGDNLEVLKVLQSHYYGKVKMIYIDPPYNTGNDFVYNDDFKDGVRNYLDWSKQVNDDGKKTSSNAESEGRYHSNWLSMMYPRLKLARNLLSNDGVIFISIDDSENSNLRRIADEIFGEQNFVNQVSVNMKNIAGASGGGEDKRLKKNIETLLIYSRSYRDFKGFRKVYSYQEIGDLVEEYKKTGKSWKYTSVLVSAGDPTYIGSTKDGEGNDIKIYERRNFEIQSVSRVAKREGISEAEVYNKYSDLIFQTAMPQSSIRPRVMEFVNNTDSDSELYSIKYVPRSGRNRGVEYEQFYRGANFRLFAWLRDVAEKRDGKLYKKHPKGTYWDYASETKNLSKEGDIAFPNGKKPVSFLKQLIEMQTENDSIVLDFFAGSGSTGHAVMELNHADDGNRNFVLVQLPEPASDNSDFSTISELCRQRLRNIAEDLEKQGGKAGFRSFKLVDTHFAKWSLDSSVSEQELQQELVAIEGSVHDEATVEDLMTELLLKQGLSLSETVEYVEIAGVQLCAIRLDDLEDSGESAVEVLMYLDEQAPPTLEQLRSITSTKPTRLVFLEDAFQGSDELKTNLVQMCKTNNVELWTA